VSGTRYVVAILPVGGAEMVTSPVDFGRRFKNVKISIGYKEYFSMNRHNYCF
jgi:hypothetical protein